MTESTRPLARLRRFPGWAAWATLFALLVAWTTHTLEWPQVLAASLAFGLGAALVAIRRERAPTAQHLRALSMLVSAWSDSDFATSIREPGDPDLLELTRALNALGGQLRNERQRLVQRELLLDTVVQNTPLALLLCSLPGQIVYANIAARQMLAQGRRLLWFNRAMALVLLATAAWMATA